MLRTILAPPADMCLEDISSIQEGHLAVWLYPELEPGMLGKDIQSRYV